MTRDLFLILSCFIIIISIVGIRIYASCQLEKLYDQLYILKTDALFGHNVSTYFDTYIKMVTFRANFYLFLSYYMKEERFKCYHDYMSDSYPTFSKYVDEILLK